MKRKSIAFLPLTICLIASASAQSLQDGLVAYYDFEETGPAGLANKAPNATDHDGTYLGEISSIPGSGAGFSGDASYPGAVSTNTTDRSLLLAGKALNVAKANTAATAGKGQFQVSTLTSRGSGVDGGGTLGTEFTVSAWYYVASDADNNSTSGDIIRNTVFEAALDGATNTQVYDISWATSGNNSTYVPYLNATAGTASTVANNQWHHVLHTVTSDGTTSTLNSYVNGTLSATITAPTNTVDFRGIHFGAHRGGGRILDGMMDEIAVWNRSMDADEVIQVHAQGAAGLPLIEPAGTPLLFWDTNGLTAGSGGPAPSGDWDGSNWSADPLGETTTANWQDGQIAEFGAGSDASGSYSVALNGTRQAAEIRVRTGQLTLQGGTLQLTGGSALRSLPGSGLTLASALDAPSLTARGDITLQNAASISGPLSTAAGTLRLENDFSFGGLSGTGTLHLPTANLTLLPPAGTSFSFSGPMAGDGTVLLSGPGTQILTRASDAFTGGFTIENGTLVLIGTKTHSATTQVNGGLLVTDGSLAGPLQVAAGASISPGNTSQGDTRTTLRLEADSNAILGNLVIDLNATNDTPGLGNNDLLDVAANLTFGPASTVTPRFINGIPAPGASFEFAWVNGTRTGTPSVDPAFQARNRYQFAIQPGEFSPEDLQLTITGGEPEFLVWTGDGTSNRWEVAGTQNWSAGGSPSAFLLPDNVDFNDSGNNTLPIEIVGEVIPSSIIVDADEKDYTWAGTGTVTGGGGLDKYGAATLTLLNQNTFSGPVRIFGGRVDVGDGTTTGSLGGSGDIQISDGASLRFLRSDSLNLGRRITGGGELIQAGTGTLRLGQAGNNGNITLHSGTFQALDGAWATSYFSTANRQIVVHGGTLVTSTHTLGGLGGAFNRPDITLHSGGTWQLNAEQYMNAGDLILHGGTILVTAVNLRLQGGTMLVGESANGSLITRSGSGVVTLFASPTFQVADGEAAADLTLSAPIGQDGTQGFTKTGPGRMLLTANNSQSGTITLSEGTLQVGDGGESGNLGSSPIVNNASLEIHRSDSPTFANEISGTGSLGFHGSGTITLSGPNSFTGNTTVASGTLVLDSSGRLSFTLNGTSTNAISGTGSADFQGGFHIDLSAADLTDGNSWTLASVASQSFGPTFTLTSSAGTFAKSGTTHTLIAAGKTWTFQESTATLSVSDETFLGDGASLKISTGNELGTSTLRLSGGNLWFGEAVSLTNDIILIGPAASNTFGGTIPLDFLLVGGGGGGGGRDSSGGGGGGGVLSNVSPSNNPPVIVAPGESLPLFVGDGGAGGGVSSSGGAAGQGTNGQSSTLADRTALGGGGGGSYNTNGKTGASGGGGGRSNAGGAATENQGFAGGNGSGGTNTGASTADAGAGGGGAGAPGSNGVAGSAGGGGKGGDGIASTFLPVELAEALTLGQLFENQIYFGGGGGGTPHRNGTNVPSGLGGLGGGGAGSLNSTSTFATPGTANTGGGGGASRSDNASRGIGGKGGSGLVVVRYPGEARATGGNDIRSLGGQTYHSFTTTGAGTLSFGPFTGTSSATLTGTLTGSGGFTWNSTGTLTLTTASSYSGDTVIQAGTLALPHASLADGSSVFLDNGATLHLTHGQTDTVHALWINGVQQPAGTYDAANSNGAITGTGSLLVTSGPDSPAGYEGWIAGFFPGETNPAITGPNADPNRDGVANALVYLFGGDPKNGNNRALLPTATLTSNPGGSLPDGDYLLVTYRRDAAANVTATVEHAETLSGSWSTASAGNGGVVVVETPDAFAPGIHKVEVFIPRSAQRMFTRVAASTTP